MRIGIDIDGVLTDLEQFQLDYGSKFAYEKGKSKIINVNGYELNNIYDLTNEEYDEFWDKYFLEYAKNEKPRKYADEIIKKLKEDGHEIYIITARYFTENDKKRANTTIEMTIIDWLKKNDINYDKIIFSPENKEDICKENQIDLMIEDAPYNVKNLSKIIPVLCFDAGYNKECSGENIIRCYSWYDIYSKI